MNIIEKIASRGLVFVLAVAILGAGFIMSADNDRVANAETLASVYLTNKATAKTTEASPPSARSAPASRKNASTVYVTMTDVSTTNAVGNSHLLDANKVVITVAEADANTKVAATSASQNIADASATHATGMTPVLQGKAGDPVIDSDSDGDLSDEVSVQDCADGETPTYSGTAWTGTCNDASVVWQVVSVANGDSATNTVSKPMITIISNTAATAGHGAGALVDGDDIFAGYYTSAVNTFEVKAWSTVQLEANASWISVVETGRNTGVFEAEFIVADTEGVNDNVAATVMASTQAGGDVHTTLSQCGTSGNAAVVSDGAAADGRWDALGGQNADCEMKFLADDQDLAAADITVAAGGDIAGTYTLAAGEFLADEDHDGSVLDSIYFIDDGTGTDIANGNQGTLINVTAIVCSTVADCSVAHTASRTMTITVKPPVLIDHGTADTADVFAAVSNNVVDQAKVDGAAAGAISNTVTAADLLTNRVGSDTISTGAGNLGAYANGAPNTIYTGVQTTGINRTPVVEAQANSTITVQYQDLTDGLSATAATTGTKQKETVTVDASAPAPSISSPVASSSFKDRQPTFKGSVSDIGSGIDVSTVSIYVDMTNAVADATQVTSAKLAGAWLGGAGTINLVDKYDAMAATMDNTTTMVDGVTSLTWTVTTSANIPCATGSADGTAASGLNDTGGAGVHTNFVGAVSCNTTVATPDVTVDYFISATDIAGNRGFSDSITTDTDAAVTGDPYTINIDEVKPSLDSANTETGVYYNAGTTAEKTGATDRIVVAFDDEILAADAADFKITTDAGAVLTPIAAEVGPNVSGGTDFRRNVYLTLPSALATNETPKVELIDNVSDLAGNTNKSGTVTGAVDKLKPVLTIAVSGGSGTGTDSNAADKLTKSAMVIDITTSEVLSGNPTVSLFTERYGTTGTSALLQNCDVDTVAAAADATCATVSNKTVIDTDKDGSLTDEITLASGASNGVSAALLAGLTVKSVTNSGENVVVVLTNGSAVAGVANTGDIVAITAVSEDDAAGSSATTTDVAAEGTVASVAVDSLNYKATFSGTSFSDASTEDSKSIILSATDVNGNTGTLGHRDQTNAAATTFRLDKTAPVLSQDPDGDSTPGSTTTLPRPYVIWDFTDNSNVTVNTATFGGDDVLALLATTNNKKYFMVPAADLAAATYVVAGKGTDLAGNAGTTTSYNLAVSTRKDYKATILAGWNLMSFPSDPIDGSVGSVFSNTGIDQVVGYDASAKGSPWTVATSDAGTFSGSLSNISEGNGYWVHSTEFSTQAVALTGPEGPSASAPPSISSIALASGWNLVGVTDATKANTQANEGACINSMKNYLGADGGSSVTKAYEYNTTNLAWTEVDITNDTACATATDAQAVNVGEAFWVFAKPDSGGLLTPIVP